MSGALNILFRNAMRTWSMRIELTAMIMHAIDIQKEYLARRFQSKDVTSKLLLNSSALSGEITAPSSQYWMISLRNPARLLLILICRPLATHQVSVAD